MADVYRDLEMEYEESEPAVIELEIQEGSGGTLPYYDGDYNVVPKVTNQVLETKNKSMRDDVTIEEIPYAEVSNPQGGVTATIAYEL